MYNYIYVVYYHFIEYEIINIVELVYSWYVCSIDWLVQFLVIISVIETTQFNMKSMFVSFLFNLGVLEPIRMHHADGNSDLYIDGGVICNYPIYAFDGMFTVLIHVKFIKTSLLSK